MDKRQSIHHTAKEKTRTANNRRLGEEYERQAAAYLSRLGVLILEKNYRCRSGEIDLIGLDGRYLVFIEVKYRRSAKNGDPAESVTPCKQQRIRHSAKNYLYMHRYGEDTPCRFDVVSILGGEIHWIRDAF